MNWKVALITFASVILYAYALVCFGLAGPNIQSVALVAGGYILKYGLLSFGFFMAAFLPYRINKALEMRKQKKYEIESEQKIIAAAQKAKEIKDTEKTLKEYSTLLLQKEGNNNQASSQEFKDIMKVMENQTEKLINLKKQYNKIITSSI